MTDDAPPHVTLSHSPICTPSTPYIWRKSHRTFNPPLIGVGSELHEKVSTVESTSMRLPLRPAKAGTCPDGFNAPTSYRTRRRKGSRFVSASNSVSSSPARARLTTCKDSSAAAAVMAMSSSVCASVAVNAIGQKTPRFTIS